MAYTVSHDETVPANHTTFESQPGYVRNTKTSIRERLQLGGMYFPSTHDELAGEYSYLRMANQGSAPAAVATKWMLYVTSAGLFVREPGGTSIQITSTTGISGSSFVTGDWILSTVTTAHGGWTNVSATYSNKFIRINATPLTTGGADTHSHGIGSYAASVSGTTSAANSPDPFHAGPDAFSISVPAHVHTFSASASMSGTSASGDNVPAYVQVVIFQKD